MSPFCPEFPGDSVWVLSKPTILQFSSPELHPPEGSPSWSSRFATGFSSSEDGTGVSWLPCRRGWQVLTLLPFHASPSPAPSPCPDPCRSLPEAFPSTPGQLTAARFYLKSIPGQVTSEAPHSLQKVVPIPSAPDPHCVSNLTVSRLSSPPSGHASSSNPCCCLFLKCPHSPLAPGFCTCCFL